MALADVDPLMERKRQSWTPWDVRSESDFLCRAGLCRSQCHARACERNGRNWSKPHRCLPAAAHSSKSAGTPRIATATCGGFASPIRFVQRCIASINRLCLEVLNVQGKLSVRRRRLRGSESIGVSLLSLYAVQEIARHALHCEHVRRAGRFSVAAWTR